MIDLYYWTTPNGHKITIFLEEAGLEYRIIPVHIGKGEQFAPAFLEIAPNNRIPAIVDHAPADGGMPAAMFESGAILLYLAEKIRRFLPDAPRGRYEAVQWLMWQMGGFGPMLGQAHHFRDYAPAQIEYAVERYTREARRLYGVLERQLTRRAFICEEYSIADMAVYPWAAPHARQGVDLDDFPEVRRWLETVAARPAVLRAYEKGKALQPVVEMAAAERQALFGETTNE